MNSPLCQPIFCEFLIISLWHNQDKFFKRQLSSYKKRLTIDRIYAMIDNINERGFTVNIYDSIDSLIGGTPLLRLSRIEKEYGLKTPLLAKLESMNPAGSAKDRVALNMIRRAEECGLLSPGATIVEPTSGNTGIGLCAVAAARGYRVILTMPDSMSLERRSLLSAYGAVLVLTPAALGMDGAVREAQRIASETPGAFLPGQFDNPSNPEAHYLTTGPEIYRDTDGKLSAFIACVGTGGTVSGVGKYLKEQSADIRILAVEPADSPLITEGRAAPHKLQGIGANFIPENFDREICDGVLTATYEGAVEAARALARREGILCGISSGAALSCAIRYALREAPPLPIVVLLPDTGERYLSADLFE